jgi:hypothetical protein
VTGVNCWVRVAPSKVPSFGSAWCVSPRPALSLLRSRPPSTLCLATSVARYGFRAPSSSLQARQRLTAAVCGSVDPSCGTSRSSRCRRPPPAEADCGGAHGVTSSSGFDHQLPAAQRCIRLARSARAARCLPEFSSPSTLRARGVRDASASRPRVPPGLPHPAAFRLQGFAPS